MGAAAGAAAFGPAGCGPTGPLDARVWKPLAENPLPFAGLATSLPEEHDYSPVLEGRLPAEIRGTLYRIGPGLFDRDGHRKRMILDGDGMVTAFDFDGRGGVRFRNRFVRTSKYLAEEKAGDFLFPTWATPAPGGSTANLGLATAAAASVTVIHRNGSLYAFDEGALPYELDPDSLETRGESLLGLAPGLTNYGAHWKVDPENGDWLHFGTEYGFEDFVHLTIFRADGSLRSHRKVRIPRRVYLHDWFVTRSHLVLDLQPGFIGLGRVLRKVLGFGTAAGMISWEPEEGNLLMVVEREGNRPPRFLEHEPMWMWHALNAYERSDGEIVCDFVGAPTAVGLGSDEAPFFRLMRGELPPQSQEEEEIFVRRYRIGRDLKRMSRETLADDSGYEMPNIYQGFSGRPYRFGYLARDGQALRFWSSLARLDTYSGKLESFEFGPGFFCCEPIFVPLPGRALRAGDPDEPGYLLSLVYASEARRSFLAVLRADRLADGPLCRLWLRHHVPLSLHGFWHAA
jgi:all-trans-8'-apo-beta-carotenal 15,15'-oxygenase